MSNILRLGLTGGIGCGKSTVAGLLASYGARVIDADAISRDLTVSGGNAIPLIVRSFGPSFINADGALKRDHMRSLIYSDATARLKLEGIIHPLVDRAIQSETFSAMTDRCKVIVFDVPLLIESPLWRQRVNHLLVVDSTPEVQVDRVMTRSGMTAIQVEKIIASQVSRELRLRAADTVICNVTLSLAQLASEVQYMSNSFGLSCP